MSEDPTPAPSPTDQSTPAAERSAHDAPAKPQDAWPVVEVAPGVWKLRRIVTLEAALDKAEAEAVQLRAALLKLERWGSCFIENTPITAETLWREFPAAIHAARDVLIATKLDEKKAP